MLFEEGPLVPPITLYSQRRLNEDAFKTVKSNTTAARRMAEIFERTLLATAINVETVPRRNSPGCGAHPLTTSASHLAALLRQLDLHL